MEKIHLNGLKVLLVEDNVFNQMIASKILENWKCVVEIAGNGNIAIEKIRKTDFDLILMDIQLPKLNGYETTQFIRNNMQKPKNEVPIIAMTAHAIDNEVEKCLGSGMNDYISKPFDETRLYEKILKVIQPKNEIDVSSHQSLKIKKYLNLDYLEKHFKDDDNLILNLIIVFMSELPVTIDAMESAINLNDWKTYQKLIYKILPSVLFMGVNDLKEILEIMDTYVSDLKTEQIPHLFKKVKVISYDLINELEIEKSKRE